MHNFLLKNEFVQELSDETLQLTLIDVSLIQSILQAELYRREVMVKFKSNKASKKDKTKRKHNVKSKKIKEK